MLRPIFFLSAAFILVFQASLGAAPLFGGASLSLSGEGETLSGFTQYELKFLLYEEGYYRIYGHSRLKYPLSSQLAGGRVSAAFRNFELSFGYWGEFHSSKSRDMKDFDWLSDTEGEHLTLAYGAATPYTDMYYLSLGLSYNFKFTILRLGPFFRYNKYHSEFIMTDLHQIWYYDPENGTELDPPVEYDVAGQVLYYEQDLSLPIFGASFGLSAWPGKLELFTNLGFSPLVDVDDYDKHTIREDSLEAWNEGSGGSAKLLELGGRVKVYAGFWLAGLFSYCDYSINTEGIQRTRDEDTGEYVTVGGLDTQVRGVMRTLKVNLSYIFSI